MIQGLFWNDDITPYHLGHQFGEVYKDRDYDRFMPKKKEGTLCIDIGANIGVTSYFFSHYFERVISLEPFTEHFNCLTQMLEFNKINNVTPINKALYFKEGEFDFGGPDSNKTMTSLHTATWEQGKPKQKTQTITLSKLFEENNVDHVDFMKMDIEGSEFEVLGSSDFGSVADKIGTLFVERHGWAGREPRQLEDSLKIRGFKVEKVPGEADLLVATK